MSINDNLRAWTGRTLWLMLAFGVVVVSVAIVLAIVLFALAKAGGLPFSMPKAE
jgi:hypothetical protein